MNFSIQKIHYSLSVNERLFSSVSKVTCSVGGEITKSFYLGRCVYCASFIFNVDFPAFYSPAASFVIVLSDPSSASTMSCVTGLVSQDGKSSTLLRWVVSLVSFQ